MSLVFADSSLFRNGKFQFMIHDNFMLQVTEVMDLDSLSTEIEIPICNRRSKDEVTK